MEKITFKTFIRKIEKIIFFPFNKKNRFLYKSLFVSLLPILKQIHTSKATDIIITNSHDFDIPLFSRNHHLSIELSKLGFFILFGEEKRSDFSKINERLLVVNTCTGLISALLSGKNIYYFVYSTKGANVSYIKLLQKLGIKIVYEYIDEIDDTIFKSSESFVFRQELKEVNPALIIVSAKKLHQEIKQEFSDDKILFNQNGVCLEDFSEESSLMPEDIKELINTKKPIVGYYGAIAPWLNYELINKMTQERAEYNFVFIGCDYDGNSLSKIHNRENLFFLGAKPYKELHLYSRLFDIAIIPFQEGNIALSTSPLKLFEYMSVKKPVVCTKDLIECYGYDGVLISENNEDFVQNLDKAMELSKNPEVQNKLFQYASQNTWATRAKEIAERLKGLSLEK